MSVTAREVLGAYTEEQLLTMSELTSTLAYHNLVVKHLLGPHNYRHGGNLYVEIAPVESFYRGAYTYTAEVTILSDGSFEASGLDEPTIDLLEDDFDRFDTGDISFAGFKRR